MKDGRGLWVPMGDTNFQDLVAWPEPTKTHKIHWDGSR